jgi:hypothetical protein
MKRALKQGRCAPHIKLGGRAFFPPASPQASAEATRIVSATRKTIQTRPRSAIQPPAFAEFSEDSVCALIILGIAEFVRSDAQTLTNFIRPDTTRTHY